MLHLCVPSMLLYPFFVFTFHTQVSLELLNSRDISVAVVRNNNVGHLVPSAINKLIFIAQ